MSDPMEDSAKGAANGQENAVSSEVAQNRSEKSEAVDGSEASGDKLPSSPDGASRSDNSAEDKPRANDKHQDGKQPKGVKSEETSEPAEDEDAEMKDADHHEISSSPAVKSEETNTDSLSNKTTNTENKEANDDGKRKSEEDATGEEPQAKKTKTEELGEDGEELTPLEKARRAAERTRIAMLPELDPQDLVPEGSGLPKHQHKYALSAIRAIKRLKDASPFVAPVDPERQGVPQYFEYIKQPMDLGTMEKKLVDNKYDSIKEFVDDFNLIISNCIIFNGEEALISKMGLSIGQSFKKQLSNMPTYDATRKGSQAAAVAAATSPAASGLAAAVGASGAGGGAGGAGSGAGSGAALSNGGDDDSALHEEPQHVGKRSSTTTTILGPNGLPTLRRKSTIDGRPKREIRPPRQPGSYVGSGTGEGRPRNKKYAAELRFAGQVLREMQGRKLEGIAFPFLQPVDPIEQGVPMYFEVIKEPMDLSTIQKKLAEGIYYNADEFESDVRLMFRNCYTFNPEGTPVNVMGHKLEAYFDSRWVDKPIAGAQTAEESDVSDVDEEYAESGMINPAIDVLEEQLKLIKKQLKRLKKDALADYYKRGHRRSAGPKRRQSSHSIAGGSGHGGSGSGASHKPLPTEMTYEMKRELRDKIDKLPEKKIRTVIAIIQESMPDLGNNGQDEIELEVDALDTNTLLRLYNYAVLGRREEPGTNSAYQGTGGSGVESGSGSGGFNGSSGEFDAAGQPSKRRSKALSEEEHNRKIAEIHNKLKEFDNASSPTGASDSLAAAGPAPGGLSAADSDSSDEDRGGFESDDSSSEEE